MPDARAFEATWQLQPERSDYQHGLPPSDGTYRIGAIPGGLHFTLDWHEASGAAEHREFSLTWEGEEPASLELVDPNTLNTAVEKDGIVVAHATRILHADGQLEIIQRGFAPDGTPFLNRAWYLKVG